MNYLKKYDVMIIDTNIENRMRLRSLAGAVHIFDKIHQVSTFKDALTRLQSEESIDFIFVVDRFTPEAFDTFQKSALQTRLGSAAVYILIVQPSSNAEKRNANLENVQGGPDGFLYEPCSVDSLCALADLIDQVRDDRSANRELAAFKLFVEDIIIHINHLAQIQALEYDTTSARLRIKDKCRLLKTLEENSLNRYFNVAQDIFPQTIPPKPVSGTIKYTGKSKRLKDKMGAKMLNQLMSRE